MAKRAWRTVDGLEAEQITRKLIPKFLSDKGFQDIEDHLKPFGSSVSQTILTTGSDGRRLSIRVKLCWRPRGTGPTHSAVQLLSKIRTGDWESEIQAYVGKAQLNGVTHFLLARREGDEITEAALVPAGDVLRIWCAQRDISRELISTGLLGRRKKNHAMNGSSPTIWLTDDSAPSVTNALWMDESVQDLVKFQFQVLQPPDDTYADLDGIDTALIGSDVSGRLNGLRSFVKRDRRVRLEVLRRADGKCERCQISRSFLSFLDVHHILAAEKSDRFWTCVAICPNCHRDAHFAPDCDEINSSLLTWANQFRPNSSH